NAAQWQIIQRIADPAQPGCLFVVGDPKQSIYGFRGADVSVFEQVRDAIAARGAAVALDRSFRTHRLLIDCFNDLFARLLVRNAGSPVREYEIEFDGAMGAHRETAPCDDPALELVLIDKNAVKDAGYDEEGAARAAEAREIARRVRRMVEDGRPIYDKAHRSVRPMSYG